jgi:regulator of protease activity HflC (stomatin/prohibitin superfamily)
MITRDAEDTMERLSRDHGPAVRKLAFPALWAILALIVLLNSYTIVPPGFVGVAVTLGNVSQSVWDPGMHMKFPVITKAVLMSTRLDKHPVAAAAASKDLQQVTAEVTVPFSLRPESAPGVFQSLGSARDFISTIVDPGVMESVKAVTAQFTAEELITKRETVKGEIESKVKDYIRAALQDKKLSGAIDVGVVAITHFDFSADFNNSIEQKVKAEQDALRAENEKRKQVTQAEANRDSLKAQADGDAYALDTRSKAEAAAIQRKADALRANPGLVQLNAVDKWDGKLPQYMTGNAPLPFLSVGGK